MTLIKLTSSAEYFVYISVHNIQSIEQYNSEYARVRLLSGDIFVQESADEILDLLDKVHGVYIPNQGEK